MVRAATSWKKRSKRTRRLGPAVKPPPGIESRYALALRQQVKGYARRIQSALEPLLKELAAREDADSDRSRVKSTIQRLRAQLKADKSPAKRAVDATGTANTEAMNKMIAPVTAGIPIWKGTTPKDRQILSRAVTENVRLIESIPERMLDDVEKVLYESLAKGSRVETIRERLLERYDVSEGRADLIARDQVLKLNAQLVEERSSEMGIQGYTWRTSQDDRVRPMHVDLEGSKQTWDEPPVTNEEGDENHPGEDYQCLPGDVQVAFPGSVDRCFRRWYAGQLTLLVTTTGKALRCTPNHPVLTQAGWKPAKLVDVGDYVFEVEQQVPYGTEHAVEHGVHASDFVQACIEAGGHSSGVVGVASQFHNDGTVGHEVDVVDVDDHLFLHIEATAAKQGRKLTLSVPDASGLGLGDLEHGLSTLGLPTASGIGSSGDRPPLLERGIGESDHVGLRPTTDLNAPLLEFSEKSRPTDAELTRDTQGGLPSEVGAYGPLLIPRMVASTDAIGFEGWVYNFSTHAGWYTSAGLVTHNCRCTAEADVEGFLAELGI